MLTLFVCPFGICRLASESLRGDYSKIQPGDCIVAFSQADIFSIKRMVESRTKYKCCTIYGQLPPETRSTQARLFNEPNTGYDVLVASDAIGMGLNLSIRRVIFHTAIKQGNKKTGPQWVSASAVRQIAGRAGRLSSGFKYGEVTAWQEEDLAYIKAAMAVDMEPLSSVGIFPSVEQIEVFGNSLLAATRLTGADTNPAPEMEYSELEDLDENGGAVDSPTVPSSLDSRAKDNVALDTKDVKLATVLKKFMELAKYDGRYFLCEHEDMVVVSNWLHSIPLTLADR